MESNNLAFYIRTSPRTISSSLITNGLSSTLTMLTSCSRSKVKPHKLISISKFSSEPCFFTRKSLPLVTFVINYTIVSSFPSFTTMTNNSSSSRSNFKLDSKIPPISPLLNKYSRSTKISVGSCCGRGDCLTIGQGWKD